MSSLFQSVAEVFRTRQIKKASDFDDLARTMSSATQPSAAEIAELLEAAGKTPQELEAEVDRLRQRRQYASNALELASVASREGGA